jgi:hypothetical protein
MSGWRLSIANGVLLACYFVPAWVVGAVRIVTSPIQGLFEQPNVAFGIFVSDQLQLSSLATVRLSWLLALGRLTVAAFFVVFVALAIRASVRKVRGCDEALALALGIGSCISFAGMIFAARIGEAAALQLHATELLLLLGGAILMLIEQPLQAREERRAGALAFQ